MNLYQLRTEKGMTQIDVAKQVGCSLSSYRLWEAGVTKPNDKNLKRLREVLGGNV